MSGPAFTVLEKEYADESERFSFRDFIKHCTVVRMGSEYATHEDAAKWYAEDSDAWEWDTDEPHEFLVGDSSATRLSDLHVVTVTKVLSIDYPTTSKGNYERGRGK